jgi:hypothetical protein
LVNLFESNIDVCSYIPFHMELFAIGVESSSTPL